MTTWRSLSSYKRPIRFAQKLDRGHFDVDKTTFDLSVRSQRRRVKHRSPKDILNEIATGRESAKVLKKGGCYEERVGDKTQRTV